MGPAKAHSGQPRHQSNQAIALIEELERIVDVFQTEIAAAERASEVTDPAHAQYPAIALDAGRRRDKLVSSIEFLKIWLSYHARDREP